MKLKENMEEKQKNSLLISSFIGGGHTEPVLEFYDKTWTDTTKGIEPLKDCRYDISWDWLMVAVDKIEELGFNFYMGRSNIGISVTSESPGFFETAYCFRMKNESKITGVYNVVLKFIEWYNNFIKWYKDYVQDKI